MPGPSIPSIVIERYSYELPPDRIATYPLDERDASKLLRFSAVEGSIEHYHFRDLASLLPEGSGLVMNSTRVIAARLFLSKQTGGRVEVLLVDPTFPSADPVIALQSTNRSTWNCMIGGRNVHEGAVLTHESSGLMVTVLERNGTGASVDLHWEGGKTLGSVLEHIGRLPLPPYIHREVEAVDAERYQTVYAKEEGSVAAPTAGLHFTQRVLDQITSRNISTIQLTLHVGLGTFQPVTVADARDHAMHAERFGVSYEAVSYLARHASSDTPWLTLVGTTSMRTMESLFVVGARIALGILPESEFVEVDQWAAFDESLSDVSRAQAFTALRDWMQTKKLANLWGQTSIMIAPGCRIASADALITNFHQPGNTLMLLVAAFMGTENWQKVYNAALENDYRFLSYGDSSLLVR